MSTENKIMALNSNKKINGGITKIVRNLNKKIKWESTKMALNSNKKNKWENHKNRAKFK